MRRLLKWLGIVSACAFVIALSAAPVLAQDVPVIPEPDWTAEGIAAIVALTPILVRILVWGASLLFQRVPKWALPVLALLLPFVETWIGGIEAGPIVTALLGLAAIGVREIVDRLLTKPFDLGGKFTVNVGDYVVSRSRLAA